MFRILVVGVKGFAKELLETVIQNDLKAEITFYDDVSDDLPERLFERFPIIRSEQEASVYFRNVDVAFAIGVGHPRLRLKFLDKFSELGGKPTTVISPFAKIGAYKNIIGEGVCILTDAVLETNNQIGRGSLIHVGALVSHDVSIGEFCEISPRASLLGGVRIGDYSRLGTGCVILPRVSVGDNAVIGAGAVVTKDVMDGMTVGGIPARPLEK